MYRRSDILPMKLKMIFWSFCTFITYLSHDDSTIWNEKSTLLNNIIIIIIIVIIIIMFQMNTIMS